MKFFKIIVILGIIFLQAQFCFANVNESAYLDQGKFFLDRALSNEYPELNNTYLKKAQYYYYVASKNTPPSIDALIGLGRVYMLQEKMELAKETFFRAYSLDPYNADANFYYAQYLYKIDDFQTAVLYYEKAYSLGYRDSELNKKMIKTCYMKLGDEEKAQEFE